MAAALALLSSILFGAGDFYGGLAARRIPAPAVVLRSNAVGLLGLALAAPLFAAPSLVGSDLGWGAAGGLAGGVGILLLYRGLAAGTMSVVAPLTAVLTAVVPVVAGLVDGERPAAVSLAGIPVALVAIALLAREPQDDDASAGLTPVALVSALGAGIGFGFFYVALDATSDDAGLWPLVAGRCTSVTMFALIVATVGSARVGSDAARRSPTWAFLLVCGLFDAIANALFLLATQQGLLTLVGVLGSLYPASTVVLATVVVGERLARLQRLGVLLALGAVVLITVG